MTSVALLQALRNKYGEEYDAKNCVIFVPKSAPAVDNSGEAILHLPQHLVLNGCQISSCGSEKDLKKHCSKVTELDLAQNELASWDEIKKILGTLEKVNFLNLSNNPLEDMTVAEDESATVSYLNKLVLNNTKINQKEIMKLLKFLPKLQELHLSLNGYTSVSLEGCHPEVTSLYFNGNNIDLWMELAKLGANFPNLQNLVLIDTDISELGTESESSQAFPNLKALNVSQTNISKWEEVEKLNNFPSLEEVRITGIPLLEEMSKEKKRLMAIAYLPKIKKLNGSVIQQEERENGERMLLRSHFKTEFKPARFFELESKYGKLEELVEIDLSAAKKINLTVKFEGRSKIQTFSEEDTVEEVKKQLQAFTQLDCNQFKITYFDITGWVSSNDMKIQKETLKNYGIEEGDGLLIEIKTD